MIISVRAIVKGRVQGVGFRWFVQQQAQRLRITGYVKNLANGDVEFVAEGEEEEVLRLLDKARKGPTFSRVTDLFTESLPPSDRYESFEVTY